MKIEYKSTAETPTSWPRLMRGTASGDVYIAYEFSEEAFCILDGRVSDKSNLEDLPAGFTVTLTNE